MVSGFTKLPILNPCGTSNEELKIIVANRKDENNAYKLAKKSLKRARDGRHSLPSRDI